ELAYDDLDAPVARVHTEPVTFPFGPALERAMVVSVERIVRAAQRLADGVAEPITRLGLRPQAVAAPAAAPVAQATPPAAPAPAPARAPAAGPVAEGEAITMPFGDLTVSEGRIVRWLKSAGDAVKAGEIVAEIETDKAVVEIESPIAGTLAQ